MRLTSLILGLAAFAGASPSKILEARQSVGDGPFGPAGFQTHASLPRHTIYRPNNAAAAGAMPVLIWGNGACSGDGTSARNFLTQIASYGFLVVSQGVPGGGGSTTVDEMRQAVTWAANGAGGAFNVDRTKIMTAGYSCGGTEAYAFVDDARVSSIGIFNSGMLGNYDLAKTIRKPVIIALGGPSDMAYPNGERDYNNIPASTPTWKGNLNRVGHGGTYGEANGGLYAKAAYKWLQWQFKGDQAAGAYFVGNAALSDGWNDVASKSINVGGTTPGNPPPTTTSPPPTTTSPPTTPPPSTSCASLYGQCGGSGWSGPTCCSQGTCRVSNQWYSQCL
ncbi:uncharacterized protein PpBr36_06596 [Pyricularia pennisetigena]|uniref:uncharacterized protein n=1 Tax=Pyricularia pennisetigena TaxID=1578925 RepID=UPI00114F90CE|nr:uncharacterized protein PpBr36_06596 [Pyricularia pennisetigena]TLS23681.1 hypothetical protein PpBr36_06596 [Pyricularia pennisetigena]